MWIFLNDAFISAVENHKNPDLLHVRARFAGDLERALGVDPAQVLETPAGDYRYRADVTRPTLANAIAQAALNIDYTNFKASVPDNARHDAYLGAWSAMKSAQSRAHRIPAAQGDLFADAGEDQELDAEEDYFARAWNQGQEVADTDRLPPWVDDDEPVDPWGDWRLPGGME